MLIVGVIILEHLTSGVVLKLFYLAKSKTGPSFFGLMRLVTAGPVKERKDYSLEIYAWNT